MLNRKTVLAIIPARGGSKGVPRKNIRMVAGRPLIAWTIEEAKKSKYIDRLILSSENSEIIEVAKKWGCEVPFIRHQYLAQDETPAIDVILYTIKKLSEKYDYVVLLQPTSPLRLVEDIDKCIELCIEKKAKASISMSEAKKSPYWMYRVDWKGNLLPIINYDLNDKRRQDHPKTYCPNGAIYIAQTNWLKKEKTFSTNQTIPFIMPEDRSVDIDTFFDLQVCEMLLNVRKPTNTN